jgi:7,8-dihydropterin-6-yl-methyl-4-(beta-D-ribofuranosyl)aminobenzene 5'-phosphate synthase
MKIVTLVENSAISDDFESIHGVSFYIETRKHTLLFDMGPDDTFIKNAATLNIDLDKVDIAIVSHGHNDHGGGLERFMSINNHAMIYIKASAFDNLFSEKASKEKHYIGLKQRLKHEKRVVFTKNYTHLDNGVALFSGVEAKRYIPLGNDHLYKQSGKVLTKDTFEHEQNLILKENDKYTLLSGCSHKGIINIMDHFYKLKGVYPDQVIGGFHLSKGLKGSDQETLFKSFTETLRSTNAQFVTGHCTGDVMFEALSSTLGERIKSFKSGSILEV